MDLGRLRGTDYVVGVLAVALLGSLFLDWYEPRLGGDASLSAWEAYAVTDVVLAAFAVMALGIVVLSATQRTSAVPIAWTSITTLASLVAVGFAVVAALTVPEDALVREVGPAVGLALTLGLAGAVWSTMRSERPGPAVARSPRSDVETLPTPQP